MVCFFYMLLQYDNCVAVSDPMPKLRLHNDQLNSPPSSSQRNQQRLEPGSMSVYDRSPEESPRGPGVIGLHDFLREIESSASLAEARHQKQNPNDNAVSTARSRIAMNQVCFHDSVYR